eukprot:3103675-Rhodomonas_salina.2
MECPIPTVLSLSIFVDAQSAMRCTNAALSAYALWKRYPVLTERMVLPGRSFPALAAYHGARVRQNTLLILCFGCAMFGPDMGHATSQNYLKVSPVGLVSGSSSVLPPSRLPRHAVPI